MAVHAAVAVEVVVVTGAPPSNARNLLAERANHHGVTERLQADVDVLPRGPQPAHPAAAATRHEAIQDFPSLLQGRAGTICFTLHLGRKSVPTPIAPLFTKTTPLRRIVNGLRNHSENNSPNQRPKRGGTHLPLEPFPLRGPPPGRPARVEPREQGPSAPEVARRGRVGSDTLVTPPRAASRG